MHRSIVLIVHNVRSCYNVGSLLRTAEGIGVKNVYLSGYTPYPLMANDTRLPHSAKKLHAQIQKTALGAETSQHWEHVETVPDLLQSLQDSGYSVAALEQAADSLALPDYTAPEQIALVVGREVEGIEPEVRAICDNTIEIPMFGRKESFNVVQAAAMALYELRFH